MALMQGNLVYCPKINSDPEINFNKLQNGTLPKTLEARQHTKENDKKNQFK